MINYRRFEERSPDRQYRTLLAKIKDEGELVQTQQEEPALEFIGQLFNFSLENGFPIVTERDLVAPDPKTGRSQFVSAIAELCAFLNGAQTLDEMKKFGCGWWARWATPEKCAKRGLPSGDLGPGSYGAAWGRLPTSGSAPLDQITTLIEQIEEHPHLRTLEVSPWVPQYIPRGRGRIQKVVVAPCHGWFRININTEKRTMTLVHRQRSADAPVGLVFNLIQYAALLLMIAQVTDYTPKKLVYFIDNGHIYLKQMEAVNKLISSPEMLLPTVTLDPSVKNIFDFRPHHFSVSDYHPQNERMVIWTPV